MPKEQRAKERQSGTGRDKSVSKGGAGGKYTWGAPGSEGTAPEPVMSKGDPNYDPDEAN